MKKITMNKKTKEIFNKQFNINNMETKKQPILQDIHYAMIFIFACMILPFMMTLAYLDIINLIK